MDKEELFFPPIDKSWPKFLGQGFTPFIQIDEKEKGLDYNCMCVDFDLSLQSKLDFTLQKQKIEKRKEEKKPFFFRLHFQFSKDFSSYFNPVFFETYQFALQVFQKEILIPYLEQSFGIGFDFGELNLNFLDDFQAFDAFKDYLVSTYLNFEERFGFPVDQLDSNRFDRFVQSESHLYQVRLISEYLHRFISEIPDGLELYCLLKIEGASDLDYLRASSTDRFPYIRTGFKGCFFPFQALNVEEGLMVGGGIGLKKIETIRPVYGLVVPFEEQFNFKNSSSYQNLLDRIQAQGVAVFALYDDSMVENWQELHGLIVHTEFFSLSLRRKCLGFQAADGKIILFGEKDVDLEGIKWEKWEREEVRGRGI